MRPPLFFCYGLTVQPYYTTFHWLQRQLRIVQIFIATCMGNLQKRFHPDCAGGRFVHIQMVKCHNKPTETSVHGVIAMIKVDRTQMF